MKPFRFLSLPLAVGLAVALCPASAAASITAGQKECEKAFINKIKKIEKIDISALEPESYCAASEGTENNKIKDPSQRPKLELSKKEEIKTSYAGACRASYEAIQLVYLKLAESRAKICEEIHTELEEKFPSCLSNKPVDTCKEHLTEMSDILEKGKNQLADDITKSRKFLKDYSTWNTDAKDKFIADLKELRNFRNDQVKMAATVTPAGSSHIVDASQQASTNLQQYLDKLEKRKIPVRSGISRAAANAPIASPIQEQEDARKFVESFREKLKNFKNDENKDFVAKFKNFREKLNRPDPTGPLANTFKQTAPVAAPLATSLLSGNNSSPPSSSSIGGGSGALPALALAGAAGLAFSAGKSTGGSSLPEADGPVMTPNIKAAPPTSFDELKGTPTSPGGVLAEPNSDAIENSDTPAGTGAGGTNSGSAAANGYGGGASSFPGGGTKPKNNSARTPATTATTAGGDEALSPFSGDLRPAPRPAAAADTTGNEVSSLLGKMKDLFNLDEGFGTDMPALDHMSEGVVTPADSGAPYIGTEEGDYSEEYAEESQEEYASADGQMQGSNPLGNIEVTLFRRVHARHFKCMEKGLVLLMQQELPE